MNSFIQNIIQSNLINFIVVVAFFIWLTPKLKIGEKLENLAGEIKSFVNESENEKTKAEKKLSDVNVRLEKLPDVINKIEAGAKRNIDGLIKKSQAETQERINVIDNNATRIMDLETKKFKSKLINLLSSASVNLAQENAVKQLDNNRELHDKYISDAIDEIDGIEL